MIMPYLHFNGNCEEAFNFYAEAFGGKSKACHDSITSNKVMHSQVMLTETGGVSGSDQSDEKAPFQIPNVDPSRPWVL